MHPMAQLLNAAVENNTNCRPRNFGTKAPRANILEGDQDYRIVMDMPGVRNEDLDISLENETLTVKAERNLEVPEGYTSRRHEVHNKVTLQRSFDLGSVVDSEKISAKLDTGILTLTLPKSEQSVPRRIEVE